MVAGTGVETYRPSPIRHQDLTLAENKPEFIGWRPLGTRVPGIKPARIETDVPAITGVSFSGHVPRRLILMVAYIVSFGIHWCLMSMKPGKLN